VVDGGEPADALHLTLAFLGEAADIPPDVFQALLAEAEQVAVQLGPIEANVFGAAAWNTAGDTPSMVLNIGDRTGDGEARTLVEAHLGARAAISAAGGTSDWSIPDQHSPWVAHMCLAYGAPALMDPVDAALGAEGPIVFDKLRVTSGPDAYDFPLTAQPQEDAMDRADVVAAVREALAGFAAQLPAGTTLNLDAGTVLAAGTPNASGAPIPGGDGPAPQPGEHLRATMHVRGESTGANDTGRVLVNTDYREPPFAFNWQLRSSAHGGMPEVAHIGNVVRVVEDGPALYAFVTLDLGGADGQEYARRSVDGIERWVSIGLDETVPANVTVTWPPASDQPPDPTADEEQVVLPLRETIDGGRIGELTAVSVPAQADATIEPTEELRMLLGAPEPQPLVAAADATVTGATDLPIADRGHTWDGAGATGRVFDLYTDAAGKVDTTAVARAFLYRDPQADPATKGAYKLGYADVVNGTLQIVPAGVAATAGGRGVDSASIPDAEKATIRTKICTLYSKVQAKYDDWPDCPFGAGASPATNAAALDSSSSCGCGGSCGHCDPGLSPPTAADMVQAITAAAATIVIPDLPPATWFEAPRDVPMDGALNIGADGRVWGLLAPKGTGHRAFATSGRRQEVPWGNVDYDRFMGAWAVTEQGKVHAGPLTMDCGHAPIYRPNAQAGPAHYDNACSVIGMVAVGEDADLGGVWMAGALLPGVTADQVARALACRCSGDWQPHPDKSGSTELIACLLVPSPGFASAHQGATTRHEGGVLVASSVPVHGRVAPIRPAPVGDGRYANVVTMVADATTGSPAQRVLNLTKE
jgi:2'-5' RNA ligase